MILLSPRYTRTDTRFPDPTVFRSLDELRQRLQSAGALEGASDHAVNKSLYARDPDGIEFEVMWLTPPELWGDDEDQAIIRPLDLTADKQRFGASTESRSRSDERRVGKEGVRKCRSRGWPYN